MVLQLEIPKRITRDPDNTGLVRILRKRGKTQTIPLNYKACQAVVSYLRVRPRVDHDTLFVTKFKTPMSKRAVQYTITKYLQEVGSATLPPTHFATQWQRIMLPEELTSKPCRRRSAMSDWKRLLSMCPWLKLPSRRRCKSMRYSKVRESGNISALRYSYG
jgi:hypothetical protein